MRILPLTHVPKKRLSEAVCHRGPTRYASPAQRWEEVRLTERCGHLRDAEQWAVHMSFRFGWRWLACSILYQRSMHCVDDLRWDYTSNNPSYFPDDQAVLSSWFHRSPTFGSFVGGHCFSALSSILHDCAEGPLNFAGSQLFKMVAVLGAAPLLRNIDNFQQLADQAGRLSWRTFFAAASTSSFFFGGIARAANRFSARRSCKTGLPGLPPFFITPFPFFSLAALLVLPCKPFVLKPCAIDSEITEFVDLRRQVKWRNDVDTSA